MHTAQITIHADRICEPLPAVARHIPSMMSVKERMLLFALASSDYRGDGVIIDAGVFCGASTVCLGAGLRANPACAAIVARSPRPIHTYEYGIVNPGMLPFFARHGVAGDWQVGDSFARYLQDNIAPVADLVTLQMGDIMTARWPGDPIEIMFLDVVKSHDIQLHVMRQFMPSLIPGGILIQQDYFIDGLPFLKILQEHLADHFEYLGEIQSSAVFRLIKPIAPGQFAADPLLAITGARKLDLLDQARDRSIDPARRLMCDLGKVRYLTTIADLPGARALLERLPCAYPDEFGARQTPRLKSAVRAATNRAHGRTVGPAVRVPAL